MRARSLNASFSNLRAADTATWDICSVIGRSDDEGAQRLATIVFFSDDNDSSTSYVHRTDRSRVHKRFHRLVVPNVQ